MSNILVKNPDDLLIVRKLWSSVGPFLVGRSQKRYNLPVELFFLRPVHTEKTVKDYRLKTTVMRSRITKTAISLDLRVVYSISIESPDFFLSYDIT